MLILSRVCAEFTDRNGAVIHRITPAMTGLFHDAPDAIRDNLLFRMLIADGSIKTPEDAKKERNLEQDPMAGATADGKDKEKVPETSGKPAKGTKAKADEKPAEAEAKK